MLQTSQFKSLIIFFLFFCNAQLQSFNKDSTNLNFNCEYTQKDNLPITDEIQKNIEDFNIKLMAIYFPQFYEFEENNIFWGKGFTEWTLLNNYTGDIKKPHVDIGQYNMLDYNVRKKQGELAKEYGINAFCYYHYWFKDKKVMYQGIEKILEDNEPDLPFILCWANESWTRTWSPWLSNEGEILLKQEYGTEEDWIKHYNYLLQFFKHPNYIKENNCPILYIYRINLIFEQEAIQMLKLWKQMIKNDGLDGLKIVAILGGVCTEILPEYDEFIEGYAIHQPTYGFSKYKIKPLFIDNKQSNYNAQSFYEKINESKKNVKDLTRGIFYGFDNTSRKPNNHSLRFINLSYSAFEKLIRDTIKSIAEEPNDLNNFILLNSWNEWSEQAMIEPNNNDGYKILEIIQKYFKKDK